jgi:hypothetical protein
LAGRGAGRSKKRVEITETIMEINDLRDFACRQEEFEAAAKKHKRRKKPKIPEGPFLQVSAFSLSLPSSLMSKNMRLCAIIPPLDGNTSS